MSDLSLQELEKRLTCSICLDRYKNPKLLPCQHTFCAQPCLKNIADLHFKRLKCPECRVTHQLTHQGIEALPNNLTILGFLDLYNQKSMENSSDRCSECLQRRENLNKCLECANFFCSNCKSNHLAQIKNEIQQSVPLLRRTLPKLSEKVGYFEQKNRLIEQNFETIKHDITANIEKLIEELKKRESQLHSEAEVFMQTQLRTIGLEKENSQVELASLTSFCDSVENSLSRSNDNELVMMKKQCNNFIEQLRNDSINTSVNKIQFTSFNYNDLLNSIQRFGEISSTQPQTITRTNLNEPQILYQSLSNTISDFRNQNHTQTQRKRRTWNQSDEQLAASTITSTSIFGPNPFENRPKSKPIFGGGNELPGEIPIEQTRRPKSRPIFGGSGGNEVPSTDRPLELPRRPKSRQIFGNGSQTERHSSPPRMMRQGTFTIDSSQQQQNQSQRGGRRRAKSPMSFNIMLNEPSASIQFEMPDESNIFAIDSNRNPRVNYAGKVKHKFQFGRQGRDLSELIWPLGIAVNPIDQNILVADSNNNRIQVFEPNGLFLQSFGSQGKRQNQFDNPTGICVDTMGNIFVSDSKNHRIQVFDRYFRFVRVLGEGFGSAPGQLNTPWGLSVNRFSEVFICDKENDRICVFHLNGKFIRSFGVRGNRPGQLEKPSYNFVSNENKVHVSDSANNRIQIFDPYGTVLFYFGNEGNRPDQMRQPRGITSNLEGFIFVADSGNSRVQVYRPDGSHVCNFPNDSRFKFLEGICILSNGDIACVDRDNHRILIF